MVTTLVMLAAVVDNELMLVILLPVVMLELVVTSTLEKGREIEIERETSYSDIILDATVRFLLEIKEEKLPARLVRHFSASSLEEMSNLSLP